MMAGYMNIDPSFPERILRMAEKDQEWRHETASTMARAEEFAVRIGALTVPVLGLLMLVAGVVVSALGAPWHAALVIGGLPTLVAALGSFVAQVRRPATEPSEAHSTIRRRSRSEA